MTKPWLGWIISILSGSLSGSEAISVIVTEDCSVTEITWDSTNGGWLFEFSYTTTEIIALSPSAPFNSGTTVNSSSPKKSCSGKYDTISPEILTVPLAGGVSNS